MGSMDERERREQYEYERRRAARRAARRKQRRRENAVKTVCIFCFVIILAVVGIQLKNFLKDRAKNSITETVEETKVVTTPPDYDVQLLDVNEYSRPGIAIEKVNGIVIHYTANPGTTAQQNRDYFQGLRFSGETYASSHFVIGLSGELIQCIPCNEIAYASNDRNADTISIECCIPDDTGEFAEPTYNTLVHLVAWLVGRYELDVEDVIRHYDVTGKNCPKYYVEHEAAWEQLKKDIRDYIDIYGTTENLPNDS